MPRHTHPRPKSGHSRSAIRAARERTIHRRQQIVQAHGYIGHRMRRRVGSDFWRKRHPLIAAAEERLFERLGRFGQRGPLYNVSCADIFALDGEDRRLLGWKALSGLDKQLSPWLLGYVCDCCYCNRPYLRGPEQNRWRREVRAELLAEESGRSHARERSTPSRGYDCRRGKRW